jgi:hypothetical protein
LSSHFIVEASAAVAVASVDAATPKTDKILCVSPLVLVVDHPFLMPDSSSSSPLCSQSCHHMSPDYFLAVVSEAVTKVSCELQGGVQWQKKKKTMTAARMLLN